MKRTALLLAGLLAVSSLQAQELGRLFFTPEERAALDARKLPFEEWHLAEGSIDLGVAPPEGVFYSRMSASSHTRGHRYAPEFTGSVLAWLEAHGRRVVNGGRALELEVSKVKQYLALNAAGVSGDFTYVSSAGGAFLEWLEGRELPGVVALATGKR